MELQNKFLDTHSISGGIGMNEKMAKECTKLCLEEQIKLLAKCGSNQGSVNYISDYIDKLQQQLKQLENEQI